MTRLRPRLVDFHAHLDLYPDLEEAIRLCDRSEVATLAVTTTPRAFPRNLALAQKSAYVRVALGLHPQLVAERAAEISMFEELLPQTRYVGEVGLDASPRFYRSFDRQKDVFGRILRLCGEAGGKVLSVHSVRSVKHVLDMVETFLPADRGRVVLHWFTGSVSEARRAVDLGCYFSINEQMAHSPKFEAFLKAVPSKRLLTETDGPFVERDGLPIEPGDVEPTLIAVGNLSSRSPNQIAQLVRDNLSTLLV
jgi:TatD DNase family protein